MRTRRLRFPWPPGQISRRNRSDALAMKLTSIFRLLITAWRRRMGQHGMVKVTFFSESRRHFGSSSLVLFWSGATFVRNSSWNRLVV